MPVNIKDLIASLPDEDLAKIFHDELILKEILTNYVVAMIGLLRDKKDLWRGEHQLFNTLETETNLLRKEELIKRRSGLLLAIRELDEQIVRSQEHFNAYMMHVITVDLAKMEAITRKEIRFTETEREKCRKAAYAWARTIQTLAHEH